MANNEISGPVVTTYLADWIHRIGTPRYTYRFVFVPETIGSIAYIHNNLEMLKKNVIAGINVTCIGDERTYSYLPSRNGNTYADKISKYVLSYVDKHYKSYSWLDRGSDERQYCSPGVDLPVCSVMRSKYGEYPEYHTSLDNFEVVTAKGLAGGLKVLKMIVSILETNIVPESVHLCEPQLGKRQLCRTDKTNMPHDLLKNMANALSYCDGTCDLIDISKKLGISYIDTEKSASLLLKHDLIKANV